MIRKTITYTDYDENERVEDFYFNLSRAELLKMEVEIGGGIRQFLSKIVQEKDQKKIFGFFEEFIFKSYGQKSLDGKKLLKSPEILQDFANTEAYSELLWELVTDAKVAADFVNGVLPKKI